MANLKDTKNPESLQGISVEMDRLVEAGVLEIGKFYTIETIAPIYHGRLVAVTPTFFVTEETSWLGDVGQRSEYESGAAPVEANWVGRKLHFTTAMLNIGVAPLQTAQSKPSKVR